VTQLQARQRPYRVIDYDASAIENTLEFRDGFIAVMRASSV
jgi:hypothetical protein